MNLVLTIAWRNLFRHKGKTLVIGTILFLGALIMTIGNGVISGMNKAMQENIVDSFTGDLLLIAKEQKSDAVLFNMTGETMVPILNYKALKPHLDQYELIDRYLPGGIGYVWILNESGNPIDQYIFGVNFAEYYQFFDDSLQLVEGRFFKPRERGVLIPTQIRKWIYNYCTYWPIPVNTTLNVENLTDEAKANLHRLDTRTELVFMGLSKKNSTLDILSQVIGVVKYRSLNGILGFYGIVDIESFREAMGYLTASDADTKLNKEVKSLLEFGNSDLDALFSSDVETIAGNAAFDLSMGSLKVEKKKTEVADIEAGAYNIIFVKLKDGVDLKEAIESINTYADENNLNIRAVSWQKAIGVMGQISVIMKTSLLVFVGFIFFVAIIIIMNTLSMAAMERISEIGMMRAVGARKWFVSKMFTAETFMLSAVFGGLGISLGIIIVRVIDALNITTDNEMLQIFYGGSAFSPMLDIGDIVGCIIQLAIVTILAVIYPALVARKITALDAITRD